MSSLRAAVTLWALCSLAACGGGSSAVDVTGTERAAGADGRIEVEALSDTDRRVVVDLSHLPPAGSVLEGATGYVVWYRPTGYPWRRAGDLAFDAEARTGALTFQAPFPVFDVRVTAEVEPEDEGQRRLAEEPSEHVVISRAISS